MKPEAPSYDEIFQRNIGLLTEEAQELLRNSTVAVAGLGGVGGIGAETLAREGIGCLKIGDPGVFDAPDLNRQVGALYSTLGRKKAEVISERIKDINPDINLDVYYEGANIKNMDKFIKGADLVIDAIDYNAPEDKLELYRKARESSIYVISSPIPAMGTSMLIFDPKGMTVEEFWNFPEENDKIRAHKIDVKKTMGFELDYVPGEYYKKMEQDKPYIPTFAGAANISGGVTGIMAVKVLLHIAQKKNPERFKEYGSLEIIIVPRGIRIDGWSTDYCGVF